MLSTRDAVRLVPPRIGAPDAAIWVVPVLGMGIVFLLFAMGVLGKSPVGPNGLPVPPGPNDLPRFLLYPVAAFCLILGGLGIIGLFNAIREGTRQQQLFHDDPRPGSRWLLDYPWNPATSRDRSPGLALGGVASVAWLALFFVPFWWIAYSGRGDCLLLVLLGVFEAALLAILLPSIIAGLRRVLFGPTWLMLRDPPYAVGGVMEVQWCSGRGMRNLLRIECSLRCLHKREAASVQRTKGYVIHVLWSEHHDVPCPETLLPTQAVRVRFDLPADAPPTRIDDADPRYWVLEVRAVRRGVDFVGTYLVPVYRVRPAGRGRSMS